jgi:hypothetical protein
MISFSEKFDAKTILELLSRGLDYYLKSWCDIDDEFGYFGSISPEKFNMESVCSSSPVIEYVIRPHLQICCILAVYICKEEYKPLCAVAGIEPDKIAQMLRRGINWACETHITGTLDVEHFLERKRWGENWRSSQWAVMLGLGAHLARQYIDDELMEKVKKVLSFEADRFIGVVPPSGSGTDTKLEENALDSMVMAWAIAMNNEHPHRPDWYRTLAIWSLNIASCINDVADHTEYLEKSVGKYSTTQNLYPDMTAENHGFFHPDILTYGMWVVLSMAAFSLNNIEPPDFLRRKNHQKTFDLLLRFCLPCGLIYPPAGQDLPFFLPRPFALAWGLWNNDPRAHSLTIKLLSWMDSMLVATDKNPGPWVFGFEAASEGWELLFQSQTGFELAMLAIMPFPDELRFYSSGQLENAIDTRHIYPFVEVCYRRDVRSTRSVAWKALNNHPTIGLNIHSYSELIAPHKADLLGIPSVGEHIKDWEVVFHNDYLHKDGFDTCGRIVYSGNNGEKLLTRNIRVLTWGDDGFVIFDRIVAEKAMKIEDQYLSTLYLVNDFWTKNKINFCSGSLRETFTTNQKRQREVSCPSFWASIESTVLFQFFWGRTKGLVYVPSGRRNSPPYWKNCRLDMLAVRVDEHYAMAGDTVYQVGFFVGAGKGPRPLKCAGEAGEFFSGLVIMDGKNTSGIN